MSDKAAKVCDEQNERVTDVMRSFVIQLYAPLTRRHSRCDIRAAATHRATPHRLTRCCFDFMASTTTTTIHVTAGKGRRTEFRPINTNDVHIMRNGSLYFRALREEDDETFYLCSASNGIGEISKAISLKVHSKF